MEKTAKNVDEAVLAALSELGVTREEVNVEVIEEGSKGFLGIGAKDAVVRVTLKEKTAAAAEQKSEKPEKAPAKVSKTNEDPVKTAEDFLGGIFKAMNLDVNVNAEKCEDNTMSIDLSGENMGIVIGKRGDTLDSLQYLTSLVVNKNAEEHIRVSLDTEHYREKRSEALVALAKRLADKVERSGRKFTLEPMNPYERRIIHSSLQNNDAVTTFSVGSEPYRKVVIAPKNPKPAYRKHRSDYKSDYKNDYKHEKTQTAVEDGEDTSSYATTYKADFKPTQHKAEYKNFEDYLAAHNTDH